MKRKITAKLYEWKNMKKLLETIVFAFNNEQ